MNQSDVLETRKDNCSPVYTSRGLQQALPYSTLVLDEPSGPGAYTPLVLNRVRRFSLALDEV